MKTIDLNCDMGELPGQIADGTQERLMASLTSVNIACGGHAGDRVMMRATVEQALRWRLAIGAHPGYADRENFGRLELHLSADEVAAVVFEQVERLAEIAGRSGAQLTHVKPHGALYNQAARDASMARAIARGVARWGQVVTLVGMAGSQMLEVFREEGFSVGAEAFADRRYESDGTLRSRKFPDALISDPVEAARQAVGIVERGIVVASDGSEVRVDAQTICIHGDATGAVATAEAVFGALTGRGFKTKSLSQTGSPPDVHS